MCPAGAHARLMGVIAVRCMCTPALQTSSLWTLRTKAWVPPRCPARGLWSVTAPSLCHVWSTYSGPGSYFWPQLPTRSVGGQTMKGPPSIHWLLCEVSLLSRQQLMGSVTGKPTEGCRSPMKMASWAAPTG